jgi:hypothetical protein
MQWLLWVELVYIYYSQLHCMAVDRNFFHQCHMRWKCSSPRSHTWGDMRNEKIMLGLTLMNPFNELTQLMPVTQRVRYAMVTKILIGFMIGA